MRLVVLVRFSGVLGSFEYLAPQSINIGRDLAIS